MFLNSGMYREIGSFKRTLPSSIIIMIAALVTGLVIDAMRNIVSAVTGFFVSLSMTP